jgi:hypothetical protein
VFSVDHTAPVILWPKGQDSLAQGLYLLSVAVCGPKGRGNLTLGLMSPTEWVLKGPLPYGENCPPIKTVRIPTSGAPSGLNTLLWVTQGKPGKPWAKLSRPFGPQRTTLNRYWCLATIMLSLRDKSHSPMVRPRIKLALMGFNPWESPTTRRALKGRTKAKLLLVKGPQLLHFVVLRIISTNGRYFRLTNTLYKTLMYNTYLLCSLDHAALSCLALPGWISLEHGIA